MQLCEDTQYQGRCNEVSQNVANVSWLVRSGRPLSNAVPLPAPVPGAESLRGMASEYFPAPRNEQGRVPACTNGSANCATERANRFCQRRGWTRAAYNRQQTVAGRIYLADVLCVRAM